MSRMNIIFETALQTETMQAVPPWGGPERREAAMDRVRVQTGTGRPPRCNSVRLVHPRYPPRQGSQHAAGEPRLAVPVAGVFDAAPIDAITPQGIAHYRDSRSAKPIPRVKLAI